LDLDDWNAALETLSTPANEDAAQDYLPSFVALQSAQVKVAGRWLHKVVAGGTRQGDVWRFNVNADELSGTAEVRPSKGNAPAQLYVRHAYLNIPPSAVSDVERLLGEQPSSIPSLDIVVNELTLRGKKLGRLEIEAINRVGANALREWRLSKFNITAPEAALTANGSWMVDGPSTRRTQMSFVLAVRGLRLSEGKPAGDLHQTLTDVVTGLLIAAPVYWLFSKLLSINLPGLTQTGWL
jgi:uncharacterized protein YhdP